MSGVEFNRRDALLAGLATGLIASAAEAGPVVTPPSETVPLWPGTPPGAPSPLPIEHLVNHEGPNQPNRSVLGVSRPHFAVFRPANPNGAAMLIAPGGGYHEIWFDKEGHQIARWLNARGWTAFVLIYRLPGEGWSDRANTPLADAQRAMRLIRARASHYGIDLAKLGMMGFSAGGHLCGDLATRFAFPAYPPIDAADRLSARPAIAAPIYAVQSMHLPLVHAGSRDNLLGPDSSDALQAAHSPAHNVSAATPPCFMVHAEDDDVVPVANTVEMRAALTAAHIAVETHLFTQGGHGFALEAAPKPVAVWPELFVSWARSQGLG